MADVVLARKKKRETLFACSAPACNEKFPSEALLCHHLIDEHGRKGELVKCAFPSCGSVLKLATFRVHLSQYHPGWRGVQEKAQKIFLNDTVWDTPGPSSRDTSMLSSIHSEGEEQSTHDKSDIADEIESFFLRVAQFYLKLEGENRLPTKTTQEISEGLANLLHMNMKTKKKIIITELKNLCVSDEEKDRILTNILSADKLFCAHFEEAPGPTFTTDAKRKTFYKTHFTYIEPESINLSKDPNDPKLIHVVSPKKLLQTLLTYPSVSNQVKESWQKQEEVKETDGLLEDYRDGAVYQRSPSSKEKTVDVILFQDSFNPLKDMSSVKDDYETLGMYMSIGNMKPYIRAKLESMYLVMLVPHFKLMWDTFKGECFRHVVNEFKELETTGVQFEDKNVIVKVQIILGDNKGQNQIGGFCESFTATRYCRFCPMTRDAIRETPWEVEPFRIKEQVESDLVTFQLFSRVRNNYFHENGVKASCIFNELQDFHVTDPRLAPCLAHDVFEGLVDKYDFFLILQHFIDEEWFSLATLNKLIKTFKYSESDLKNKPAKVKSHKTGGHAVQNWTLVRLFPLIIGKARIKSLKDPYWKLFLSLKKVCEYICAPSITEAQTAELSVLVENYMYDRQQVLGVHPQPKHHMLSHYADLIVLLGPVIHLFTLRFENVHIFFKDTVRKSKNTINIGLTMAKKSALYFCYQSSKMLLMDEESCTIGARVPLHHGDQDEELRNFLTGEEFSVMAQAVTSVTLDSIHHEAGRWLLLQKQAESDDITVGQVKCVVLDSGSPILIFKLHVAKYLPKYGLFEIEKGIAFRKRPVESLKYPNPISIYKFGSRQLCFSLKHILSS